MGDLNLFSNMVSKYQNNDYVGAMQCFEEYLELKDVGIIGAMFDIYINCQIKLGLIDEARENVTRMTCLFPSQYSDMELALKYCLCDMNEELVNLIETKQFGPKECFLIAKNCFYTRKYEISKKMFELAIVKGINRVDKAKDYLRRIEIYEQDKTVFRSIKYNRFKKEGSILQPGFIVRADRLRDRYKVNKDYNDPLKVNRPYLIWKIDDNRLYCFPLSSKLRYNYQDGHILLGEKYPNYNEDRKLKDHLVCIKECDVELVCDKVDEEDFDKAMEFMYKSFGFNPVVPRNQVRMFMKDMVKKMGVEPKDIITVDDLGEKRTYYIIGINQKDKYYRGFEVDKDDCSEYFAVSDETNISMEEEIQDVCKITYIRQENLEKSFKKIIKRRN